METWPVAQHKLTNTLSMSGNIAAPHGWRSFFWLSTALSAFVTLLLIFAFPETKWQRNSNNHAGIKVGNNETQSQEEKAVSSETSSQEAAGGKEVGRGKPSKMQFLASKPDSAWWKYVVRDISTPIIIFFNPIVFWAALMLAGPAVSCLQSKNDHNNHKLTCVQDLLLMFNLTESPLLSSPVYRFNPGQVGYKIGRAHV